MGKCKQLNFRKREVRTDEKVAAHEQNKALRRKLEALQALQVHAMW